MNQTPQQKVEAARNYAKKLSWKKKESLDLATYIYDYFTSIGVELPDRKPKKESKWWAKEIEESDVELAKLYYALLSTGKTLYARFEKAEKRPEIVALATFWSKHRFDPAWLWRKSQLLRKRFSAKITTNKKLRENYTPCHLTLTLPHPEGYFNGKRFYFNELINLFHKLRRSGFWKQKVIGGEYTVEIKRSPSNNGLHIHIHSLIFIDNNESVHVLRDQIYNRWYKFLGKPTNEAGQPLRLQIDLTTIYHYEKVDGKFVMETYQVHNKETGLNEDKLRRKKIYYNKSWENSEYNSAIMEVLKYQCKTDNICENGVWDIELIKEILNESKGARFTSNFGDLYKDLINDKEPEIVNEEGEPTEKEEMGKTDLDSLINPYTLEQAKRSDFDFVVANPEKLSYFPKPDSRVMNTRKENFVFLDKNLTLKEAIDFIFPENYRIAKEKKKLLKISILTPT